MLLHLIFHSLNYNMFYYAFQYIFTLSRNYLWLYLILYVFYFIKKATIDISIMTHLICSISHNSYTNYIQYYFSTLIIGFLSTFLSNQGKVAFISTQNSIRTIIKRISPFTIILTTLFPM